MIQTYRPDHSPRHLADTIRTQLQQQLQQHKAALKRQQLAAPTSLLRSQIQQGQLNIQHIHLILDAATEKAQLREKLPNKLEKLPIIGQRRVKGLLLKLYNFLFKEQRTSQLNTIYALRELTQLTQQLLEQSQDLVELPQALHAATADDITRLQQWLVQTDQRLMQIDQLRDQAVSQEIDPQPAAIQSDRLDARQMPTAPSTSSPVSATADSELDAFYQAFAAEFSETSEHLRERLQQYIPLLRAAGLPEQAQVLDLGCGRGEWLSLLNAHGYQVCGVDRRAAMVAHCQQVGLEAFAADALSNLEARSDASLDAITGFHLIEHLPFEDCVKLMRAAFRVLRPGGLILLETVSPGDDFGSRCNVDLAPTPCPGMSFAVLQFILKYHGFTHIQRIGHAASHQSSQDTDAAEGSPLNARFYGFMDYAVIGFKA